MKLTQLTAGQHPSTQHMAVLDFKATPSLLHCSHCAVFIANLQYPTSCRTLTEGSGAIRDKISVLGVFFLDVLVLGVLLLGLCNGPHRALQRGVAGVHPRQTPQHGVEEVRVHSLQSYNFIFNLFHREVCFNLFREGGC